MDRWLLEREAMLEALHGAVGEAAAGRGSVALVTGEAGIGKTSVIATFAAEAAGRVLLTACDDLITPRTLGPLRDATLAGAGPLAEALGAGSVDGVFAALLEELALETPTVLVVEDVQWADDATLDVLAYAARRIEPLGAVLVLTCRDDELDAQHPLQRFLGALVGSRLVRLPLAPLSRDAVRALAAGTGADAGALHRVTGGNPFFVTEALASPGEAVPVSVMEAVLARVVRLGPESRAALDQLSVVPSQGDVDLVAGLLGDRFDALADAELAGVLVVRSHSVAFRHELARRAIERSLPAIRRRQLNAAVVAALRAGERPELARLMHHAVEARDVETIVVVGPDAAREAARAGSHRQALAHFEAVIPHAGRLGPRERAAVLDEYGWELYNAHRFGEAVTAGSAAAELYAGLDDAVALGDCLARVSRHLFMAGDTDAAEEAAEQAVATLAPTADASALAHASVHKGAILALTDAPEQAAPILEFARDLAARAGRSDLAALSLNYLGIARAELGKPDGIDLLRRSVDAAIAAGKLEYAARGYCNLAELLVREGRIAELEASVDDWLRFARDRGFWSHAYNLELHRCVAMVRRGRWDGALDGLRALVDSKDEPGMLYAYSVPWLGRLLARRGDGGARPMLVAAWDRAQRQRLLLGVAYAGLAVVEWAVLAGRPAMARRAGAALAPYLEYPGAAPFRAELLRYLARMREPVDVFPGCPEPWAAGLRGDFRAAADGWAAIGDPYEQALELAESEDPDAMLEALAILDGLGARAAATWVRGRLREMGRRVPRGPQPATMANPARLTGRQLMVLELVSEGMTNTEIADRLVISVRTVDHHVAAVLGKLGVRSRRDAPAAADAMGVQLSRPPAR